MEEKRKLAVTPRGYDDIGKVLEGMGTGYEYTPIEWEDLCEIERLCQFEVVFINCSGECESYAYRAKTAIRRFVEQGGSLYASDWASCFVQSAFPERLSFSERGGDEQNVVAKVMDAGLAELIGNSLELHFDLPGWKTIERVGNETRIYLRGSFSVDGGKREKDKPLLVSFDCGDGHVVYTAFHNEPQLSEKERLLLRFLVLKPITSKVAHGTRRRLITQRFSAEKENIGTINQGATSPLYSYFVPDGMNLKFMLSWRESGANLLFSLYAPDNQLYQEKSLDTSPIILTAPLAQSGNWQYQVKGVRVPYPNFPYVLTIGSQPASEAKQAIAPQFKYCRSCGSRNRGEAKFCTRCGQRFSG